MHPKGRTNEPVRMPLPTFARPVNCSILPLLACLGGLACLGVAAARAQGADLCQQAPSIVTGVTYTWTTANNRADGRSSCYDPAGGFPDSWFKYTADQDGYLTASTCGGPVVDSGVAIFDGCNARELACGDDTCGLLASTGSMVERGRTYLIRVVASRGNPRTGVLSLSFVDRCLIRRPYGAIVEPEPCGERINDGCFGDDPDQVVFAELGQVYFGTYFGLADGTLDHDSYQFVVPTRQVVSISVTGGIDTLLQVCREGCDASRPFLLKNSTPCQTGTLRFTFEPGVYRAVVRVAPPFNGNDCGLPFQTNRYVLRLGANAAGCPADFTGDGFVDFFDLDEYLRCFTDRQQCADAIDADFTGDGFTDFQDFAAFVDAFTQGC